MNQPSGLSQTIKQAALAIKKAGGKTVVFTGAGVSVESGIPPFRGADGIWTKYDSSLFDINRYKREPEVCWPGIQELFYSSMNKSQPNQAHIIISKWEKENLISFVITQNIDGLHQKAGTRNIAEYHGNVRDMVCLECGFRDKVGEKYFSQKIPKCPECGGLMKSDFIFFGEGIPVKAAEDSLRYTFLSKVFIIAGSSGEVYPAASIPFAAKEQGKTIIEINPGISAFTKEIVDFYIPLGAVDGFSALDEALKSTGE